MRSTDLLARLRLDSSQFDKSVKQSQAELQTFSRVAGALPGGRSNVFGALASDAANLAPALSSLPIGIAAVGAAMAGAGLAARRAGVDFEASLTKIATLGADAQDNLGQTRQAILDTFTSTAVTGGVADLAEANYLLQSSGRSAAEAMVDLDIAAKASVAGYTQVTTAVDGLTTVTAAWKDTQITTAQASDVLFQAVNVGKASFEQIASSLGLVAPLAASAGVRFEEVAAATALLSNQGIRTTSIMEGMRSAILNIQRPTEDFKKRYADLAREFSASRLARDGIIQFLIDFDKASGGSRDALGALLTDATGLTTALGLLRNGGKDAAAALLQMQSSAGAADKALAEVNKSTQAQEQLIKNQISSAWTQFGELLNTKTLPILEKIARVINDITDGASFAQRDVQMLIAKSGSENRPGTGFGGARGFDQANALRGVVQQFNDNPDQFLKALSRNELEQLGTELVRLRASGRFQQNDRTAISADMINKIVDERLRRDAQSQQEAAATLDGQTASAGAAEARAKDEERQRARAAATDQAKQAATEAERKQKELERERQRLIDDTTKLTAQLEAAAIEALQGTAGVLQLAMEQTLAEGAKKLASGVLSPEAKAALTAQLEQFEQLQTELIDAEREAQRTKIALDDALQLDELSAQRAIAAREAELVAILAGTQNLVARKKIQEQLSDLAAARGQLTGDVFALPGGSERQMRLQVALMGDLAQSIATVGDQLGLLPRRAVDALRGIGALAEQGKSLTDAFKAGSGASSFAKFGAIVGVAGGIASLAAGLFSESPEDKQRREELRSNTEALRGLTMRVGDLAASSASGQTIARVSSAASGILTGLSRSQLRAEVVDLPGFIARAAGVSVGELKALAESLGITLNNSMQSLVQLRDALKSADFEAFSNTFAGSMERFNDTLRADGITDPIEIFRRRIATFTDPKTGFPALAAALSGIDLSTADGRNKAGTRARALFDDLVSGNITPEQLGGLSLADARAAILEVITGARDVAGSSGTGGFNETRSITEVTGSRLAGLFSSANQYLRQIAEDIATLRSTIVVGPPAVLSPPSIAGLLTSAASGTTVVIQSLTIQLTITRDLLGADSGTALALGDTLTRAIGSGLVGEIDAQLRDRELRQRLILGNPVLS